MTHGSQRFSKRILNLEKANSKRMAGSGNKKQINGKMASNIEDNTNIV